MPFGNKVVTIELTGGSIVDALENGFSQVETGAGRHPHLSGMSVIVDLEKPAGERVLEIMVAGEALDPAKTYTLATNDYMARGGDGYSAFGAGQQIVDAIDATLMASQVIDYVAAKGTVAPKVEGRIVQK